MNTQSHSLLTQTITASLAISAHCFVDFNDAVAGAASNTLGLAVTDAAAGEAVSIDVIGTGIAQAGAAIAKGALLETNASGQAITQTSGPVVGRALQASTGAGQLIEVLLIQN